MELRKKIYLSLTIFVITTLSLVFFIIFFLFPSIRNYSHQILFQKEKELSLGIEIENIKKFKYLYPEIKPNLEKIDNLFIDAEVPVDFRNFLEKVSGLGEITISIRKSRIQHLKFIILNS